MYICGHRAEGLNPHAFIHLLHLRDPNLAETLDVYDGSADYLRNLHLDEDELTKVRGGGWEAGVGGSGTGRRYAGGTLFGRTATGAAGRGTAAKQKRRANALQLYSVPWASFPNTALSFLLKVSKARVCPCFTCLHAHFACPHFDTCHTRMFIPCRPSSAPWVTSTPTSCPTPRATQP